MLEEELLDALCVDTFLFRVMFEVSAKSYNFFESATTTFLFPTMPASDKDTRQTIVLPSCSAVASRF